MYMTSICRIGRVPMNNGSNNMNNQFNNNINNDVGNQCNNNINNQNNNTSIKQRKDDKNKTTLMILIPIIIIMVLAGLLIILGIAFVIIFPLISSWFSDNFASSTTQAYTETTEYVENQDDYTVFIYMIGTDLESRVTEDSNELYAAASNDLMEMAKCTYGDNVNIVLQTGGCSNWGFNFMSDGEVQRFELMGDGSGNMVELDNLGSVSMADSKTLSDFITWGRKSYPANHYALIFWDHGGSIPIAYGCDELYSGESLEPSDIAAALNTSQTHFDFIGFDACLMGTLENAYALSAYCDYIIASETTEPGTGYDYSRWITALGSNPNADTETICKAIIDDYSASLANVDVSYNQSLIATKYINPVYASYESLMSNADLNTASGGYTNLFTARSDSAEFTYTDTIDLYSFANYFTSTEAATLKSAIEKAVVYTKGNMDYAHGLAAYFPYSYPALYPEVRDELNAIGYNENIINSLDDYMSVYSYYISTTYSDYDISAVTSASWYDASMVEQYSGSTYVLSASASNNYMLAAKEDGDHYVIPVTSDDWSHIARIETAIYFHDADGYWIMGNDDLHWNDDNGNIIADFPSFWMVIDTQTVYYEGLTAYTDSDTNLQYANGQVYAYLNGNPDDVIAILIYWNNSMEGDGEIVGYYKVDKNTLESDGILNHFADSDYVNFLYKYMSNSSSEVTLKTLGDAHYLSSNKFFPIYGPAHNFDSLLTEAPMGISNVIVTDVYGGQYQTDLHYETDY